MPLEQHIPSIDNRRYTDIVAEVRARIPRYTPEWTDFNESDPGMAVVELFAWLSDMLLFRLGQVPELNYIKFLQLIGIELAPAQPAAAEITFPVRAGGPAWTSVAQGTQVAADVPGEATPVVFETSAPLIAIAATLASVQVQDGPSFFNYTGENNQADSTFDPLGPVAALDTALLLGFDYAGSFPEVNLNLAIFAAEESGPAASAASCGAAPVSVSSGSRLKWEYWSGSDWRQMPLLSDQTQGLLRSGHVTVKTPAGTAMKKAVIGHEPANLYWIRARVSEATYDRFPKLVAIRSNTVAARQVQTVRDEVLGGSNGAPDQTFALANAPVLADSLVIEIDQGSGKEIWKRVDDLFSSSKTDQQYVLNAATGLVRFGDGKNGAIPAANLDNRNANVVALQYSYGGGSRGNVPARAIKTPLTSLTGIDESKVSNLLAAIGGRDEQSIDDAKKRAPALLRANSRAVTAGDFEELAKQVGSVRRANAMPLYHPRFPGVSIAGVVTVIVVPDNTLDRPTPSQETLNAVCAYLNQRRLLTTEVYVVAPTYVSVQVEVTVVAGMTADAAQLKIAIEAALQTYFHPLRGGDDGLGWPFGGTIFFSKVYHRVLSIPGVERVETLAIRLDGDLTLPCTDVGIPRAALLYSLAHKATVNYESEQ